MKKNIFFSKTGGLLERCMNIYEYILQHVVEFLRIKYDIIRDFMVLMINITDKINRYKSYSKIKQILKKKKYKIFLDDCNKTVTQIMTDLRKIYCIKIYFDRSITSF